MNIRRVLGSLGDQYRWMPLNHGPIWMKLWPNFRCLFCILCELFEHVRFLVSSVLSSIMNLLWESYFFTKNKRTRLCLFVLFRILQKLINCWKFREIWMKPKLSLWVLIYRPRLDYVLVHVFFFCEDKHGRACMFSHKFDFYG